MAIVQHEEALNRKHNQLKVQIAQAYIHHIPDAELHELKKRKLAVKDALTRLQSMRKAS